MSAAGIRAGSAFVEIFAKDGKFQQAMDRVQAKMRQTGAAMQQWGQNAALGAGMLAVPMGLALRNFASFDDAIRATGAVTQSTIPQLQSLRDRAKELGSTTSFTAVQVANLMTELGRAGFRPEQINVMTESVMNLARATGTDATISAGIMAATMRQFSLDAGEAARVADVLTAAANKSFNTVESLGEAMSYAGPVAAQLGMTVEETAAILGTLGNVGIQGSNAGTALRRLLTLTGAEAVKLKDIFGVSFLDASGAVRPLVDTLGEVAAATANMASGERMKKFNDAFGLLGITGAQAIAGMVTDTRRLKDELDAAAGTAAKTASEMDAGLGGALRILWSAVEGLAISFGEALAPSVQFVAEVMTTLAGVFKWMNDEAPIVSQVVAVVTAGVLALGVAAMAGGIALKVLAGGLALVQLVLTPIGLTVILIAGAIALVVMAVRQLSPAFRKSMDDMIQWLRGGEKGLKNLKKEAGAGPDMKAIGKSIDSAAASRASLPPSTGEIGAVGMPGGIDTATLPTMGYADADVYGRASGGPSRADVGRVTLGTFGDGMGLGIAPEIADLEKPTNETAANTGRMAAMMEEAQANGGSVLPGADAPAAAAVADGAQAAVQQASVMTDLAATMKTGFGELIAAVKQQTKAAENSFATLKSIDRGLASVGVVFS